MKHGHRSIALRRYGRLRTAAVLAGLLAFGSLAAAPSLAQPAAESEHALALKAWQRANALVAEFPRGHMDLLRWEARQVPEPGPQGSHGASTDPLQPAEVLRASLRWRPELLSRPDMGGVERARLRSQWADHVRQVQAAWLEAVAANERHRYATDVLENARVGAELAQRMVQAGNWSEARLLREQLTETRAHQAWLSSGLEQRVRLESLVRLMGDVEDSQVDALAARLPARLPPLPDQAPTDPGAQALALDRWPSLDTLRASARRAGTATDLAAWDQAVDDAVRAAAAAGAAAGDPPFVADRRLAGNERIEHAAQARAALQLAIGARRSQTREAQAALTTRYALARLAQDELLARQGAAEQDTLRRYNGMLLSTWDLLASARARLAALDEAAQARLRYWLAEADWRSLLAGGRYAGAGDASETPGGNPAAGNEGGH
ncbi:MAG: hypothetical protein JNK17_07405 [Hydrogenophaga sp.]|nr:hypothetical protein [Hydrogenophaga sp.]